MNINSDRMPKKNRKDRKRERVSERVKKKEREHANANMLKCSKLSIFLSIKSLLI